MKKIIISATFIIGIIAIILVNLFVLKTDEALEKTILVAMIFFLAAFTIVGYGFKFARIDDYAWHAALVASPFMIQLVLVLLLVYLFDVDIFQAGARLSLFSVLFSVMILEDRIFKNFFE